MLESPLNPQRSSVMGRLLGRTAQFQVRHVRPVPPGSARGLVAEVYAQVERDLGGLAPPISLHSPAPAVLAAAWALLRETVLAPGLVPREVKEAVAVAVSQVNTCPYGVDVHSVALHGLGRNRDADALAEDRVTSPELLPVTGWARASRQRQLAAAARLPGPVEQAPELIGTVVTVHYLNRMVNLFLTAAPIPLGLPPTVRRAARRVAGRVVRSALDREVAPGAARELLPAAELPADLSWAAGHPTLADTYARAAAAIDAAGRRSVPASVRELVGAMLLDWDGAPPGVLRDWAYDAVAALPRADRLAGQLALQTAFASHQVEPWVIAGFRDAGEPGRPDRRERPRPDARGLIEVASWASLAAARAHGTWLWRAAGSNVEDADERTSYQP